MPLSHLLPSGWFSTCSVQFPQTEFWFLLVFSSHIHIILLSFQLINRHQYIVAVFWSFFCNIFTTCCISSMAWLFIYKWVFGHVMYNLDASVEGQQHVLDQTARVFGPLQVVVSKGRCCRKKVMEELMNSHANIHTRQTKLQFYSVKWSNSHLHLCFAPQQNFFSYFKMNHEWNWTDIIRQCDLSPSSIFHQSRTENQTRSISSASSSVYLIYESH